MHWGRRLGLTLISSCWSRFGIDFACARTSPCYCCFPTRSAPSQQPARFQHIENTARSALSLYDTRSALEPLYTELETLDALILEFRRDLAPDAQGVAGKTVPDRAAGIPSYRMITEVRKLENLIKVRGRTVQFLGDQVAERELVLGGAVLAEEGSGAGGEPAQAP